ncbi:MAG: hypothetical protein C4532_10680 [Candidatus Abyssobacteria bacterium SURF_17]|uniref:DUF2393 domain-containing protein n=1 Tax=Candidatus Abyssobacteria bacterium SURF_17 TaxID=2093361 RepID=A0A419EXH4_9BACT|nr:MAG: hypothetical protein C4532_10680 [Candidatus Abyssubacteria bacterium SURF_17]
MQETNGDPEEGGSVAAADAALPERRQPLIAVLVAMTALSIVMLLMLLAVKKPPSQGLIESKSGSGDVPPGDYSPWVTIEGHTYAIHTNVAGLRELRLDGFIRNTGEKAVRSADVRCHFRARAGGEVTKDIPLIAESELEELDGGPLMPFSGREFHARIGTLPENAEPDLLRVEVINVGLFEP